MAKFFTYVFISGMGGGGGRSSPFNVGLDQQVMVKTDIFLSFAVKDIENRSVIF
jgi:hypothetical protein